MSFVESEEEENSASESESADSGDSEVMRAQRGRHNNRNNRNMPGRAKAKRGSSGKTRKRGGRFAQYKADGFGECSKMSVLLSHSVKNDFTHTQIIKNIAPLL